MAWRWVTETDQWTKWIRVRVEGLLAEIQTGNMKSNKYNNHEVEHDIMHVCVSYGYQNKQPSFLYTALTEMECLLRGTTWNFKYNSG